MEFFLVPLFAIAGVTFGIYKVGNLVFHIRLSRGLLGMLVGFAWLISLVLPAVFYHSAGFAGSIGISLVCAAVFAWMATIYDTKNRTAQLAANVSDLAELQEESWTPAAETVLPVALREAVDSTAEKDLVDTPETIEALRQEELRQEELRQEELRQEALRQEELRQEALRQEELRQEALRQEELRQEALRQEELRQEALRQEELRQEALRQEELRQEALRQEELRQEELRQEELRQEELRQEELRQEELRQEELRQEELRQEELRQEELRQAQARPASDSLSDLLEYAFSQRSQRNYPMALDAFYRIRSQYGDSDAVPMVEAEMVSTLQSCGDYEAALTELSLALHLPAINRDSRITRVFEQKRMYLTALQDLLREQGMPNLPFEQIPVEWTEWIETKLSAGAGAQS